MNKESGNILNTILKYTTNILKSTEILFDYCNTFEELNIMKLNKEEFEKLHKNLFEASEIIDKITDKTFEEIEALL